MWYVLSTSWFTLLLNTPMTMGLTSHHAVLPCHLIHKALSALCFCPPELNAPEKPYPDNIFCCCYCCCFYIEGSCFLNSLSLFSSLSLSLLPSLLCVFHLFYFLCPFKIHLHTGHFLLFFNWNEISDFMHSTFFKILNKLLIPFSFIMLSTSVIASLSGTTTTHRLDHCFLPSILIMVFLF